MVLHARSTGPVEQLVKYAQAHVVALDPDLPIEYARPLIGRMNGSMIFLNLAAAMLSVFGVAGMLLAGMGTYGLVSYVVKQRTHEICIRIALGASGPSILRGFLAQGLKLGAIGAALGMVLALAAGSSLRAVLFGVSPTDALSFLRALVIVLAGVVLATLVPAARAARTDPLSALRHQ